MPMSQRLLDDHQRLAKLNRLAALNEHRFHCPAIHRNDWIHNLHRLDNQQRIARRDLIANRSKGWRVWFGR